ncbi:HNH endonuclease [Flavobacterium sp.]|uniref:HNH endonuclease n=1 Tax=Flavobacterium sp. TaxID=239 RepID=UPI0025E5526E|nr:HNH endonuclease [Flavobacterium sp.]
MKIDLEFPFLDFKAGYLNINKEPRRLVLLVRKDNTKTTVSYARYLMSVKLKRLLNKEEQVDHIDNNKLNDSIENLQILSGLENTRKYVVSSGKKTKDIEMECPVCNAKFSKKRKNVISKITSGKTPTCSRRCGGIYSHRKI